MSDWDILGVPKGADLEQCKKAYRVMCKKYHPDLNSGNETWAAEQFHRVNTAYENIKNGRADLIEKRVVFKKRNIVHSDFMRFVVSEV